jgi:hypothetical protein
MKTDQFIFTLIALFTLTTGCNHSNPIENTNSPIQNGPSLNENSEDIPSADSVEVALDSPTQIDLKANPSEYLPETFFIYDRIAGDLNKDGIADSVYVVKKIDSENIVENDFGEIVDRNRRGIMIFLKQNDGWELVVENLTCFSSENEDGGVYYPPQLTVVLKKGNLYIEYEHGRYGYWTYTFRLNNADFELIGFDSSENYGPITNRETSINYLTKRKLTKENINADTEESGDEIFEDTWEDIDVKELLLISKIVDFDTLRIN